MSKYDYTVGLRLWKDDVPFYGLIMGAMLRSDTDNAALLRNAWPDVWDELQQRYNAPGGLVPGDPEYAPEVEA